jgi:uncharacterized membrane protein
MKQLRVIVAIALSITGFVFGNLFLMISVSPLLLENCKWLGHVIDGLTLSWSGFFSS